MIYERYPAKDALTTGGTGFGIAAIVVGVERKFIARADGVERLTRITAFLERAQKFKGAFPHWYDKKGKVKPFGEKDDGGDIVETAFLIQGLLIAREYFNRDGKEKQLRESITRLWEGVDWNWYTNGKNCLFWHWSEKHGFAMNHRITGFNECMIAYILALASPTHPIGKEAYDAWTSTRGYATGTYLGYVLEGGSQFGGPLFFTHYSFIGLDGRMMADSYVPHGYFVRNTRHVMINRAYCLAKAPAENKYSQEDWGLTASYGYEGYSAHSPTNDKGIIAPTAALASMPYTPWYSIQVLRNLYAGKDRYWRKYGPCDAYSLKHNWSSLDKRQDYLAIDQLPITCMVENYRSGLLWRLFMNNPDIRKTLPRAGISFPEYKEGFSLSVPLLKQEGESYVTDALDLVRHPDKGEYSLPFFAKSAGEALIILSEVDGREIGKKKMNARQGINACGFIAPEGGRDNIFILSLKMKTWEDRIKIRLH